MAFDLTDIVPFGRSYAEYCAMFALTEADLVGQILDCGGGPAAFNAELTRNGGTVISVDPIYAFDSAAIRARIDEVVPDMVAKLEANRDKFRWDRSGSPAELVALRQAAMDAFLADYSAGCHEGRYLAGTLPELPVTADGFDLALVSHLLFLYGDHLDRNFHLQALRALTGRAREVRVFPLTDLNARPSAHVDPVRRTLAAEGMDSEIINVDYESQKGANQMLRIVGAPDSDAMQH
ncbi:MAG: SAM-dependent methyltransferase [Thiohalospira sp.]